VSGPIWLNWPFAGVMVIFALYHGVRLVTAGQRGRPNGYDIDLAHLLMCTAMAAMLVMTFGAHLATAWAVVVGVPTLWFILRAVMALVSGGAKAMMAPVQQVLMCAAMLFMLVVAGRPASAPLSTASGGMNMPGMAVGGPVSHDIVGGRDLTGVRRPPRPRRRPTRPPAEGCRYVARRVAVEQKTGRAPTLGWAAPGAGPQPGISAGDERHHDLHARPVGLVACAQLWSGGVVSACGWERDCVQCSGLELAGRPLCGFGASESLILAYLILMFLPAHPPM